MRRRDRRLPPLAAAEGPAAAGGSALPAAGGSQRDPRLYRPRGGRRHGGRGGDGDDGGSRTYRSTSPAAPRGSRSGRAAPAGRFPWALTPAPRLPLPARPPQQEGGGQPRGGGRRAGTAPRPRARRRPPPLRAPARARGREPGQPLRAPPRGRLTCRRAPLPGRGGDGHGHGHRHGHAAPPAAPRRLRKRCRWPPRAGVPGEQTALLTSLAASPAAGLAVAVIHAVQDDQGKGEEAKLHPAPLGWAASSSGSEGRRRPAACGAASGGGRAGGRRSAAGQRLPRGPAGAHTPPASPLGRCELGAASSISPALRGEGGGGGGGKLGSWLSRSPPFAGAPRETKKRKPETPGRGRRGAAERSHRAPQLLPASGGRALPLGTPLRPGDGLSAEGKRYLSRRRGAPRPHALRSRARRGEAAPPTFRGAAPPPSRPAAGAGERLRAAGQPPAGRRGPAAGARARRGGRRGLPATCGRRPRRAYPPPPHTPPPPPSLRPLLLCGGAGAVGRGAAAAAAGPCGLRGDARRRGTEVVLRDERSRRPALAPPGAAPRPRPRLRRALTPARR